jgi:hypothetical protein
LPSLISPLSFIFDLPFFYFLDSPLLYLPQARRSFFAAFSESIHRQCNMASCPLQYMGNAGRFVFDHFSQFTFFGPRVVLQPISPINDLSH